MMNDEKGELAVEIDVRRTPSPHSWIGTKYRLMVRCHRMLDTKGIKLKISSEFDEKTQSSREYIFKTNNLKSLSRAGK